ncbi:receptor-type tyrosine-protein phosphatase delta-like [Hydractinia symbiolongicarpus]|uniref:receptor-type tyrosine-protein phosphatase delta-like n=1 Tax=Hydractinia symbiolongicarpus TaxID=13093 RepID=UPI00254FC71D|nr:receptor-type tyrosine-protein phosphatase delta-like [Hydractinia symbiolongicarpus]
MNKGDLLLTIVCWYFCATICKVSAIAPSAVINLTASNVLSKSMDLSWQASNSTRGNITEFQVKYSYQMGDVVNVTIKKITDTSTRSYSLDGLLPNIQYKIEVSEKTDEYGPPASITVLTKVGVPQAAPTILSITNVTSTSVNVTWKPIPKYLQGSNSISYILMYGIDAPSNKTSVMGNESSVALMNLKPNSSYTLFIFGLTSYGNDGPHASKTFLTAQNGPSQPYNVTKQDAEADSVTISWSKPLNTFGVIKFYLIYLYKDDTFVRKYKVNVEEEKKLEFKITNLEPKTTYEVKIVANNNMDGEASEVLTIVTEEEKGSKSNHTNIIIGVVIVAIIVIIAVVAIVIIYRRRDSGKHLIGNANKKGTEENVSLKTADDNGAQSYGAGNEISIKLTNVLLFQLLLAYSGHKTKLRCIEKLTKTKMIKRSFFEWVITLPCIFLIIGFCHANTPQLITGLSSQTLFINETLLLNCSFTQSLDIAWYRNGNDITNDARVTTTLNIGVNNITSYILEIKNIKLSQQGNYSCLATNLKGSDKNYAFISVYDKPGNLTLTAPLITSRSLRLNWYRTEKLVFTRATRFVHILTHRENSFFNLTNVVAKNGTSGYFVFHNLTPYTTYKFKVWESIDGRNGSVENVFLATTKAEAPSAPRNVRVTTSNSTAINIVWDEPEFPNGDITKYRVKYAFYTTNMTYRTERNLHSSERKAQLSGLYPALEYTIMVSAYTVNFGSPGNLTVTTQEGIPQVAPGDLQIKNIDSNTVNVTWSPIPEYLRGGTLRGYHIYYIDIKSKTDGEKPEKLFIDVSNTSHLIDGLLPFMEYYVSIVAFTDSGEGVPAEKTFRTLEGLPSMPRNLLGGPIYFPRGEKQSIRLSWQSPVVTNGKITQYQVAYSKILVCLRNRCKREMEMYKWFFDTENYTRSDGERLHTISRALDPFSKFSVKIREATNAGWGNYSDVIEVKTDEGKPTKPWNVSAFDVSDTSLTLKWFAPAFPNGVIKRYIATIFKGSNLLNHYSVFVTTKKRILQLQINNHLEAETTYRIYVKAVNKFDGERSEPLDVTTSATPTKFPWLFVLVGCLVTVLLLALIITILLLLSRRRQQYKEVETAEDISMSNYTRSKPIAVADLKQYSAQQHANSDHGFNQEYESIRIPVSTFTYEHSQMPYNQVKNRYSNIVAYDHSRVILSPIENDPSSTYINASYIDGFETPKKYIATQGPLPETVLDFWRMIWEQQCPMIVMLAKLVEDSRVKCEQYWPEGKGLQYGDIVVTVQSVSELTDYTVRVFKLHKVNQPKSEEREVRQFHFTSWPDHGVPSHPSSVLSFVRHVMSFMGKSEQKGPYVVHCSAGVGRTGTFIAIEGCLRQMEVRNEVDVYGIVFGMRMQRNYMVQVEPQYTFIYDALLDNVVCGNTEVEPAALISKIQFLNSKDPKTGETNLAAEFKRLESGVSLNDKNQSIDAGHPDNKQKNRFLNILPYDKNRVKLLPIAGSRQSDYINASIIDGFQQKNAFIATQAPIENTVNDFWRMILEQNVHIIVMLTKLEERGQEKCYLYWPQADTVSYGSVHVEVVNIQNADDNLIVHELRLTNRETGRSWAITHFMYMGWPEYGSPSSGTELIQLIGSVQSAHRSIKNTGPILVHCSGGVGRTGVFMSVFNSIEKLKAKDVVDIFQTTRALRLQRCAMVQTMDQYLFCYQALKDYLDSFDLYTKPFVNDPQC